MVWRCTLCPLCVPSFSSIRVYVSCCQKCKVCEMKKIAYIRKKRRNHNEILAQDWVVWFASNLSLSLECLCSTIHLFRCSCKMIRSNALYRSRLPTSTWMADAISNACSTQIYLPNQIGCTSYFSTTSWFINTATFHASVLYMEAGILLNDFKNGSRNLN